MNDVNTLSAIKLDQFTSLARGEGVDLDATVKIGTFSRTLKTVTHHTTTRTNTEVREAFIASVRQQLGDRAADAVARHLGEPGKPLTARRILSSAALATAVAEDRIRAARTALLNALDAMADPSWKETSRQLFHKLVVGHMVATLPPSGDPATHFPQALVAGGVAERVKALMTVIPNSQHNGNGHLITLMQVPLSQLPLALDVIEMFPSRRNLELTQRVVRNIDNLAQLKQAGQLTLDTAWPVLFNGEAMPAKYRQVNEFAKFSVVDYLSNLTLSLIPEDKLADRPGLVGGAGALVALGVDPEVAASALMKDGDTLEVPVTEQMRKAMVVGSRQLDADLFTYECQLALDAGRTDSTFEVQSSCSSTGMHRYDFNAYARAKGNMPDVCVETLCRDLVQDITALCGKENHLQIIGVISALTQNATIGECCMDAAASRDGMVDSSQFAKQQYSISRERDGSVLVKVTPNPKSGVQFPRTYRFFPDGRQEMAECPDKIIALRRDVTVLYQNVQAAGAAQPAGAAQAAQEEIPAAKLVEAELCAARGAMAPLLLKGDGAERTVGGEGAIIAMLKPTRIAVLEAICRAAEHDDRVPPAVCKSMRHMIRPESTLVTDTTPIGIRPRVRALLDELNNGALIREYEEALFPHGVDDTNIVERYNRVLFQTQLDASLPALEQQFGRALTPLELRSRQKTADAVLSNLTSFNLRDREDLLTVEVAAEMASKVDKEKLITARQATFERFEKAMGARLFARRLPDFLSFDQKTGIALFKMRARELYDITQPLNSPTPDDDTLNLVIDDLTAWLREDVLGRAEDDSTRKLLQDLISKRFLTESGNLRTPANVRERIDRVLENVAEGRALPGIAQDEADRIVNTFVLSIKKAVPKGIIGALHTAATASDAKLFDDQGVAFTSPIQVNDAIFKLLKAFESGDLKKAYGDFLDGADSQLPSYVFFSSCLVAGLSADDRRQLLQALETPENLNLLAFYRGGIELDESNSDAVMTLAKCGYMMHTLKMALADSLPEGGRVSHVPTFDSAALPKEVLDVMLPSAKARRAALREDLRSATEFTMDAVLSQQPLDSVSEIGFQVAVADALSSLTEKRQAVDVAAANGDLSADEARNVRAALDRFQTLIQRKVGEVAALQEFHPVSFEALGRFHDQWCSAVTRVCARKPLPAALKDEIRTMIEVDNQEFVQQVIDAHDGDPSPEEIFARISGYQDRLAEMVLNKVSQSIGMHMTHRTRSAFAAELSAEWQRVLDEEPWTPISRGVTTVVDHEPISLSSKIVPARHLGNELGESYARDGINGVMCHEFTSEHAVNLARSSLHVDTGNGTMREAFSGLRHGVHCAVKISDDTERAAANKARAAEAVTAALMGRADFDQVLFDAAAARDRGEMFAVDLDITSVSLLTPDIFRAASKGGSGNERQMLREQKAAWDAVVASGVDVPLKDANGSDVVVHVWPRVTTFNFGVNKGGVHWYSGVAGGWGVSNELNEPALDAMGERVRDFVGSTRADEYTRGVVQTLFDQLREILGSKAERSDSHDAYKAAARAAVIAYLLGETPCWNCKSGKDRTGEMDVECKFLATLIASHLPIPEPGQELSDEQKRLFRALAFEGGNFEMQTYNTGLAGFKTKGVDSIEERLGGAEMRAYHAGASEYVEV